MAEVTQVLNSIDAGDPQAAGELLPLVYDELRRLAAARMVGERPGQTIQATVLVHEAWLKIAGNGEQRWENRRHFFAVAAEAMRRILVDHARARRALKRGGGAARLTLLDPDIAPGDGPDLLDLDQALQRLAALNHRQARIVELRFFAGLDTPEIAHAMGVSERTVKYEWRFARAWLHRELTRAAAPRA